MSQIQNPTAKGSRVSWNSLDGASTETSSLSRHRIQHLIGSYAVRPELAQIIAALLFQGGAQ